MISMIPEQEKIIFIKKKKIGNGIKDFKCFEILTLVSL